MATIAAVIVTFNNSDTIVPCLNSLHGALKGHESCVVVIDNNSRDGTPETITHYMSQLQQFFHQFTLLQNEDNLGFTRAVNQGMLSVKGDYYLLLNPDVELQPDTVANLLNCLAKFPDAAAAAPQLCYADGTVQPSCRAFPRKLDVVFEATGLTRFFPRNRYINRWKMVDFDHTAGRYVQQPQGAFLLLKGEIVERIGLLDERFYMFFSDVDYCRRIIEAGAKIRFCPEAVAIHHKGHSVYKNRRKMIKTSHRSFVDYFKKYDHTFRDRAATFFISIFMKIVLILRLLLNR